MTIRNIYTIALVTLSLAAAACGKKDEPRAGATTGGDTAGSSSSSSSSSTTPTGSSTDFKSDEGKFAITMPPGFPVPEESVSPMATGAGSVDLKMYTSSSGNTTAAMVAFANMAGKLKMKGKERAMLDGARDNVLKTMNGTLEKEEDIMIDGHPGRRMVFAMEPKDSPMKLQGRLQVYLVDPIMYQVFYISDKREELETPATNAYFDSFKLADEVQ